MTGGVGKNGSTVADTSVLSPGIPLAIIFYFSWSFIKRSDTTIHEWPSLTLFVLGLPIIKLSWQIVVSVSVCECVCVCVCMCVCMCVCLCACLRQCGHVYS